MIPFLLLACDSGEPTESTEPAPELSEPETNPFGDGEGCPLLDEGTHTVTVGDLDRTVTILLPENPEGAPVVFAWHWLGGTADQILSWMAMESLTAEGAIVVAPQSTGLSTEWDYLSAPEASIDVALFDDLTTCLWESHRVDADRIYSTGMSAGGLMTSYLTLHRADVLAASVPFSGGMTAEFYTTPASPIPVMVVWGGASDSYAGFSFHDASQYFSQALQDDGHFVVECMHSSGHLPPSGSHEMAWTFFSSHARGDVDTPWSGTLPDTLPSYCVIP